MGFHSLFSMRGLNCTHRVDAAHETIARYLQVIHWKKDRLVCLLIRFIFHANKTQMHRISLQMFMDHMSGLTDDIIAKLVLGDVVEE